MAAEIDITDIHSSSKWPGMLEPLLERLDHVRNTPSHADPEQC